MHQNESAVDKSFRISPPVRCSASQLFPGEFASPWFPGDRCSVITQRVHHHASAVFFFHKVPDLIFHFNAPAAAGAHLIALRFLNSLLGTLSGRISFSFSITGKMMQWNTILSLPMKWTSFGVWVVPVWRPILCRFRVTMAHCLVALIYPIGASNHTYRSWFLHCLGYSPGKLTPQSRSRV